MILVINIGNLGMSDGYPISITFYFWYTWCLNDIYTYSVYIFYESSHLHDILKKSFKFI